MAYGRLGQTEQANQNIDEAIRLNPSLKRP